MKALTKETAEKLIQEGKAKSAGYDQIKGVIIVILTPRRRVRYYR